MKNILILAVLLTFGIGLNTTAQNVYVSAATPIAFKTQVNQRARIVSGVVNGELTPTEIKVLNSEQKHIRRVKRRAKADGVVTREERVRIKRKQRRAGKRIRNQRNDLQKRHWI